MPPPLFVVSHAHANREDPSNARLLQKFVADLIEAVYQLTGIRDKDQIGFADFQDLQVGNVWNGTLSDVFQSAGVGVALYSPHYFTSEWCGREFQVMCNRRNRTPPHSAVIPVLWITCPNIPEVAKAFQYADGSFPRAYKEVGLLKLAKLSSYRDAYIKTVDRLAELIVAASKPGLRTLPPFDINDVQPAWVPGKGSSPETPMTGSVSKTCFVYLSDEGWQWTPYPGERSINSTALQIASDLDIDFDRIECDARLIEALEQATERNIPTVLMADPESVQSPVIASLLRKYDERSLGNCGVLFAWPLEARDNVRTRSEWQTISELCREKIGDAKPNHEWSTIFSQADLEARTRTVIGALRLRLLQKLTSPGATPLKAQSAFLSEAVARQGLALTTAPQIGAA